MSDDITDIKNRARPGPAFANGAEAVAWSETWCGRCVHDAMWRIHERGHGCPILLTALAGERTPAELFPGPRDEHGRYGIADQYVCTEFRGRDE